VKNGLWERVADYWQITVFEETQTTSGDLEAWQTHAGDSGTRCAGAEHVP
jgi:hypothetical protein